MRTRFPARRMEPSSTYAAPSCWPTCCAVTGLSRNASISERGKISSCLIFESSVTMSSVIPSRKYSSSFAPLWFSKYITATERWRAAAAGASEPDAVFSADAFRPESRSRLRRFRSARSSAAVWDRRSRILLERLVQNALQREGQARIELLRRRGRGVEDAVEDERRGRGGEGRDARRHFVEHDAQREQVRPRVQLLAPGLFGRHVQGRAHGAARARQVMLVEVGLRRREGRAGRFGNVAQRQRSLRQAEIQDLRGPAVHEEDVRGLDVAVHDSLRVRGIQAVGDLDADLQELRNLDGLDGDAVLEGLAFEQFHRDERPAFELADVVDRADVGVIEGRCRARFPAKPLDRLRIPGNVVRKELQRDIPAEARVPRLVDHAHAAPTQLFEDAVMGDGATDDRGGVCQRRGSLSDGADGCSRPGLVPESPTVSDPAPSRIRRGAARAETRGTSRVETRPAPTPRAPAPSTCGALPGRGGR